MTSLRIRNMHHTERLLEQVAQAALQEHLATDALFQERIALDALRQLEALIGTEELNLWLAGVQTPETTMRELYEMAIRFEVEERKRRMTCPRCGSISKEPAAVHCLSCEFELHGSQAFFERGCAWIAYRDMGIWLKKDGAYVVHNGRVSVFSGLAAAQAAIRRWQKEDTLSVAQVEVPA
jgi:hypothetical protein